MKVFNFNSSDTAWKTISGAELVNDFRVADIIFCNPISKIKNIRDDDFKTFLLNSEEYNKLSDVLDNIKLNQLIILNGRYNLYFYIKYLGVKKVGESIIGDTHSSPIIARKGIICSTKKEINVASNYDIFFYNKDYESKNISKIKHIVLDRGCSTINYLSKCDNFILSNVNFDLMAKVPEQQYLYLFNKIISKNYEQDN